MITHNLLYGSIALLSAASWAAAGILWRLIGDDISPYTMNLSKCVLGSICLAPVLLMIGVQPVDMTSFLFLGVSGLLGIALGDSFFFMSLMQLGPRLAILAASLTPVCIALFAVPLLGERPSPTAWLGMALATAGVLWVLAEKNRQTAVILDKRAGVITAFLSIVCSSAGVLCMKVGAQNVPTLQATFIRLGVGAAGVTVWGIASSRLPQWIAPLKNARIVRRIFFVVCIAVFGGFWLSLVAVKYMDATIASVLNATTPLFMLPLAAVVLREKISSRAGLGAAVAVSGVALLVLAR